MALDWGNAVEGADGSLAASLRYGHVTFHALPRADYWLVEVRCDGVAVWEDDNADHHAQNSRDAAKAKAERLYAEQAAGWIAGDMMAELMARGEKAVKRPMKKVEIAVDSGE